MTREESRKRNDEMRAYKADGHTCREVSEAFGVSYQRTKKICAGIAPQTVRNPRNQYTSTTAKAAASRLRRIEKVIEENAPGFEYAGGYTDGDGKASLRCMKCGHIETRSWNTIRHHKINGKKVRCSACYQAEIDAKKKEKPAKLNAKHEPLALPVRKPKQIELCICRECGELFIPETARAKQYCSDKCRKKASNRYSSRRKDKRLAGVKRDKGITAKSVFERDAGICYLCGGLCDWNDMEMRGTVIIAGNNYPSVDHVIPIAHGGTDTWDNVKLAHRLCNSLKSDSPQGAP